MSVVRAFELLAYERPLASIPCPSTSERLLHKLYSRKIPPLLREHSVPLGASASMDKIFASRWLSHDRVVVGTKCNSIAVIELASGQLTFIPTLDSGEPPCGQWSCGIHAVDMNPSRRLLATGGTNVNDVAVYQLPSFDPLCVGECCHSDWIFDLLWLDDQHLITGSRDGSVALWNVNEDEIVERVQQGALRKHALTRCRAKLACFVNSKIRALAINHALERAAALSFTGTLKEIDLATFSLTSRELAGLENVECVCLAVNEDGSLYAAGSRSQVTLIDARNLKTVTRIRNKHGVSGVRSVNLKHDLLSYGTGLGGIFFWDLRSHRYLLLDGKCECPLQATRCWTRPSEQLFNVLFNGCCGQSVFTHCFDPSGLRLFAGGGPLPACLYATTRRCGARCSGWNKLVSGRLPVAALRNSAPMPVGSVSNRPATR